MEVASRFGPQRIVAQHAPVSSSIAYPSRCDGYASLRLRARTLADADCPRRCQAPMRSRGDPVRQATGSSARVRRASLIAMFAVSIADPIQRRELHLADEMGSPT
jgi:hypothetical protein